jgi:hypothetical protein
MALRESTQVAWVNILDAPFVNDAGRYVSGCNEVAQPPGGVGIDLVVVIGHGESKKCPHEGGPKVH